MGEKLLRWDYGASTDPGPDSEMIAQMLVHGEQKGLSDDSQTAPNEELVFFHVQSSRKRPPSGTYSVIIVVCLGGLKI